MRLYEAGNLGGPSAALSGEILVGPDGAFATTATVPLTLFGQGSRANLNVVPGPYTLVTSQDTLRSVTTAFTVGAPRDGALLWGEVVFDVDGNGIRDVRDQPASALVTIAGPFAGAPVQALTDARGRFVVSPVRGPQPGPFQVEARADLQSQSWFASTNMSASVGQIGRADLLLEPPGPSGLPAQLLAVFGATLYVAAGDQVDTFDLAEPRHPALAGQSPPLGADIRHLTLSGATVAVVLAGGGVRLLDVTDARQPRVVASYGGPQASPGSPGVPYRSPNMNTNVAFMGQLLLVPDGDVLSILDVQVPAQPWPIGTYRPGAEVRSVTAAGRHAYVVTTDNSLRVVDLADPTQPMQIGATRVEGAGFLSPVAVTHGNAFGTLIFGHYTTSIVIDVSDPARPMQRTKVSSTLYTTDEAFAPQGDLMYVANQGLLGFGTLGAVAIGDPSSPSLLGSLEARWDPLAIAVRGAWAYALGRDNLLHVLDIGHSPAMHGVALTSLGPPPAAPAVVHDERYFSETGYRVEDDDIWEYFLSRGGVDTFGYPVSRAFVFLGCPVQLFQREAAQHCPGSGVQLLNVLDPDLFPYARVNFSTFPSPDEALKAATPKVEQADYASAILDFVAANAPDTWNGQPVHFGATFSSLITPDVAGTDDPGVLGLLNLEVWGAPISQPVADPNNADFVYQRFQRGIMHFDAASGATRGILLADYLKAVLRAADLPADLREQAAGSRMFAQYCPRVPGWICRPDELPGSDLTFAFEAS
jgi:hypothetical protein